MRTLRILLVLVAMLSVIMMTQSSLTGACVNYVQGGTGNGLDCPD